MNEQNGRPAALDVALEQFSRVALPPEVEAKLQARMQGFYIKAESAPAAVGTRPRGLRYRWAFAAAGLAAAMLLAAAVVSFGGRDAWAQVAKSLQAKPWVRMRLQIPADLPGQKIPAEMRKQPPEIWFSAQQKTAASRFMKSAQYCDFARGERWRYDPQEDTVYRESASERDQREFEHLNTLLRLVAAAGAEPELPKSSIELVERSQRDVREGDRTWTEFTFRCRDRARTPAEFTTTLRVDPDSHLPFEMRETLASPDAGKPVERVFVFDYPETGPADIYALGVARSAKVVERMLPAGAKELVAAHTKARQRRIEPYTAIVLMSLPEADFSDVHTAHRVRYDGESWRVEHADLVALLALRQQVWSKQLAPPKDDPANWWKEQVAKLTFELATDFAEPAGQAWFPDTAGYFMLGDPASPDAETTLERRPVIGPPDTLQLGVRTSAGKNTFWFDPKHDYAAIRFESDSGDNSWPYRVQIIDKLEKSPGGRWYATQVRVGDVEKSGDEPRADTGVAPVSTSVYRYFVEFD